jgi:hypothetical protein
VTPPASGKKPTQSDSANRASPCLHRYIFEHIILIAICSLFSSEFGSFFIREFKICLMHSQCQFVLKTGNSKVLVR